MAITPLAQAELCRLRQDIARLEGRLAEADRLVLDPAPSVRRQTSADNALNPRERRGRLPLGVPALDGVIGGGLPLATLHEIRAREARDGGAAAGFILAVLARLSAVGGGCSALWIIEAAAKRETGGLYAPGLLALGLDPCRIIEVAARNHSEALWAFEAALSCGGVAAAICEIRQVSLDLSETRRCALRARAAGVTGFLLRLSGEAEPSAADLRFRVAPSPAGTIGSFDAGIGRMAWRLALEKNRGGRTGSFTVEWNAYERGFDGRPEAAGRHGKEHEDPQHSAAAPPDGSSSARPSSAVEESGGGGRPILAGVRRRASS